MNLTLSPRARVILGSVVAGWLAVAAALTGADPARAADRPQIVAGPAPAGGGSITVEGSGFAAATPGIYLGVGPVGLPGFYLGQASLVGSETIWIAVGNAEGAGASGRTAPMAADGSFRVTVSIPAASTTVPAYAVYTSKAHGQGTSDPSQDTVTAVAYEDALELPDPGTADPDKADPGAEDPGSTEPDTVDPGEHDSGAVGPGQGGAGSANPVVTDPIVTDPAVTGGPAGASSAGSGSAGEISAAADEGTCVARSVSGATLSWGVKSSFRNYISGGIANGSWSTAGISYADGAFRWRNGTGTYSPDTSRGTVGYSGGVTFTGHDGALDLSIQNPRLRLGASTATLVADVHSSDMSGAATDSASVPFATIALPAAGASGGALTVTSAPATLTTEGARAFAGFYEAGTALDPVSFRLPLGASAPCDSATSGQLAQTGSQLDGAAPLLAGGMLLGGVAAMIIAARRRVQG